MVWCSVGLLESSFILLFVKMEDQLFLLKIVLEKMDVSSSFINSVLCVLMRKKLRRI